MNKKRLLYSIGLATKNSGRKRAEYLRKKNIFASYGKGGIFMGRKIPLYAKLISVGDNVWFASNVGFITHDVVHSMINNSGLSEKKLKEKVGCIKIGNNVFVGAGSALMYNVKIGNNVVVAARSVVTKDIPDNSVVAGCPARVISTLDNLIEKRLSEDTYPAGLRPKKQEISDELVKWCWENFDKQKRLFKEE